MPAVERGDCVAVYGAAGVRGNKKGTDFSVPFGSFSVSRMASAGNAISPLCLFSRERERGPQVGLCRSPSVWPVLVPQRLLALTEPGQFLDLLKEKGV